MGHLNMTFSFLARTLPWIVCSNTLNNHLLLSFNTWKIVFIYCFIKHHAEANDSDSSSRLSHIWKKVFFSFWSRIRTIFCYSSEMCQVTVWLAALSTSLYLSPTLTHVPTEWAHLLILRESLSFPVLLLRVPIWSTKTSHISKWNFCQPTN